MENRLKQNVIQIIIDEMNKNPTTSNKSNGMNYSLTASSSSTSTPKNKCRKLFNYDASTAGDSNGSLTFDPAVELDAYLNDPV
jgi:hypothetical protein